MPRVSTMLVALAACTRPLPLAAQELERTFCDDADPANHCPGEDCLCVDDTLEVVFDEAMTSSVLEYDTFLPEMRVPTAVVAEVMSSEIRGYSFAVAHSDTQLSLAARDITYDDTATFVACINIECSRRVIPGGYIVAIVLSFTAPVVLPPGRVPLVKATYSLLAEVGPAGTILRLAEGLGNPPTQIAFTIDKLTFPDRVDRGEMDCINGIDDDGDGFTDRADDDCVVREGVSRRPRRLVDGLIRRQGAAPVPFRRGDADGDGRIELADGIAILQAVLAARGQPVACLDALDADDDGRAGIADALPPLRYLFQSGPEPAPPFATCGNDPTADTLSCVESNCPGP